MDISEYDYTLVEALKAAHISVLPKAIMTEYNKIWVNALCLVTKAGGRQGFCLCENDGNGNCVIKQDFGTCATIIHIDTIFPYVEVDKKYIPDLRSDKQIIEFLCKSEHRRSDIEALLSKDGKTDEQIKADRATVKEYVNRLALKNAKMNEIERIRCERVVEYSENEKRKNNGRKKSE